MASRGDVLEVPPLGGRAVLLDTAADTDGELMRFEFFLAPAKHVVHTHLHPNQTERFSVIEGTMEGEVNGERRVVEAGGETQIPPGTPHEWWNGGEGEARLVVEFRPALRSEEMIETFARLCEQGKVPESGTPPFPYMVGMLAEFRNETRPAKVPGPIVWVMTRVLAPLLRLLGFRLPIEKRA
jgi:quercetin dioxygenase-like cupin family protein